MPNQTLKVEPEETPEYQLMRAERSAHVFHLASAVLAEMQQRGVAPTPHNYEIWFTYRSGTSPDLTRRMTALLDAEQTLAPAALDTLYAECVGPAELHVDAISSKSDAMDEAAQTLIEQLAGSQTAIREFGDALARGAARLDQDRTCDGLVQAIVTLTAETTRAVERNRELEQQLAASAARISKLRKSLADVKQEATTDTLTGLCNRRAFDVRLRRTLAQARAEPGTSSCLLLIDIDHFKRFNDTHGHRVGDLVLRLVARLLADNVKGRDTTARYGGEEFAVLLVGAELRAATVVARQICEALSSKRLVNKGTAQHFGQVTVSIGVAQARSGETAATLLERADVALYEAKRAGRNRVCTEAA
jgi:diguanylate cyclase